MSRIAVYPGSFDPLTRGHLDIIQRASKIFDHVIVAVSSNASKRNAFSVSERIEMVEESIRNLPNVDCDTISGLLVDYMRHKKSRVLIRGLRVVSDMDYEFQLASFNRRLNKDVETVFLMPDDQYTYLASSMVREIARLGAGTDQFVPPFVARRLKLKFGSPKR
ncbi:MAG: pantetheine-phosphate adenylyltransferase [Elusimicrobia bacterium CG11_big_fil_rev_8_21_14_0_20_64_6]|nr:MAG: pantetheine-phosphate adenylyltransferase [Elusimicrobia bacterium CG11_big_fil_rev_8_21_14_0_20_64_6]